MNSRIMESVMTFAQEDQRIKSVILRGSRTNPNADVDADSDYDVLYGVSEFESFLENDQWIEQFGDILILQKPDFMDRKGINSNIDQEAYLMQFKDGTRLDLIITRDELVQEVIKKDSLSKILLDKDNTLEGDEVSDVSYLIKDFNLENCVNEFLWLSFYVTKGMRRKQLMYTQNHLAMMREELFKFISYQNGGNPGAHFKYVEKQINAYELSLIKETFSNNIENALKILFEVFETHLSKEDFDKSQFEAVRYVIESQLIN